MVIWWDFKINCFNKTMKINMSDISYKMHSVSYKCVIQYVYIIKIMTKVTEGYIKSVSM